MPTIIDRAVELVPDGAAVGLGSGRAAQVFVRALADRVRTAGLRVRGVPTSDETAALAREVGVPLTTLADAGELAVAFDGADEVAPNLDLVKGWGRALVRERVVVAAARQFVVLVGEKKLVPQLGARGRLPVEVVPFAAPLAERRLRDLGLTPALDVRGGAPFVSDNGNHIFDCGLPPQEDAGPLDAAVRAVPGVVGTGFFLGLATVVLVGRDDGFELVAERWAGEPAGP